MPGVDGRTDLVLDVEGPVAEIVSRDGGDVRMVRRADGRNQPTITNLRSGQLSPDGRYAIGEDRDYYPGLRMLATADGRQVAWHGLRGIPVAAEWGAAGSVIVGTLSPTGAARPDAALTAYLCRRPRWRCVRLRSDHASGATWITQLGGSGSYVPLP